MHTTNNIGLLIFTLLTYSNLVERMMHLPVYHTYTAWEIFTTSAYLNPVHADAIPGVMPYSLSERSRFGCPLIAEILLERSITKKL